MDPVPPTADVYASRAPPTHLPSLDFIYRLRCSMSPDESVIGKPSTSQTSRVILPISGGTVSGPRISGTIVPASGADWATSLPNESVRANMTTVFESDTDKVMQFMKLDARYTLKTDDGSLIFVKSKGIYHPEPSLQSSTAGPPTNVTQNQAEWFTRLQFEANEGPFEWMNFIFAVGVLTMHEGDIIIDAYRLTNFGGRDTFPSPVPS